MTFMIRVRGIKLSDRSTAGIIKGTYLPVYMLACPNAYLHAKPMLSCAVSYIVGS